MDRFDRRTRTLRLPWGAEEISMKLPGSWEPVSILEPNAQPTVADAGHEVRRSLEEPIASLRLRELLRRERRSQSSSTMSRDLPRYPQSFPRWWKSSTGRVSKGATSRSSPRSAFTGR